MIEGIFLIGSDHSEQALNAFNFILLWGYKATKNIFLDVIFFQKLINILWCSDWICKRNDSSGIVFDQILVCSSNMLYWLSFHLGHLNMFISWIYTWFDQNFLLSDLMWEFWNWTGFKICIFLNNIFNIFDIFDLIIVLDWWDIIKILIEL